MDNKIFKYQLFPMGSPVISGEQLEYFQKMQQPNIKDAKGRTVLHAAVMLNDREIIDKLLKMGCDFLMSDNFGYRAYDYAYDNCCYNVIDYMLEKEYENKCNNYTSTNSQKPFNTGIHRLCEYSLESWGDKLIKTLQVLIKYNPKCLFETDNMISMGNITGTPLFWADRANRESEPNKLMIYLEEEMVDKLIKNVYIEEPIVSKLYTDNEQPNSDKDVVIVDNYKLSTTIKNLINEDDDAEKDSLKLKLKTLNQDHTLILEELRQAKQEFVRLQAELDVCKLDNKNLLERFECMKKCMDI